MPATTATGLKAPKIWRRPGTVAIFLWTIAYAGLAFTMLAIASVGLLVAPFALAFYIAMLIFAHFWPEAPIGPFFGVQSVAKKTAEYLWPS